MHLPFVLFLIMSASVIDNTRCDSLIEGNNKFASDIYKEIIKTESGNIIFSSLSAETVLALLRVGCKGTTAQELSKALYLPEDNQQLESQAKSLISKLQNTQAATLNIANALFLQKNFEIKKSFKDVATQDFYADTYTVDFSKSQDAANTINTWVEDKTNNTIKDLVGPNDLGASTVLVLVDALRLKANWSLQFSKSATQKNVFYKTPTNQIQVDTLHLSKKHFNYYECKKLNAKFLELPLEGNEGSVIFVVPNELDGLAQVERNVATIFKASCPLKSTYLNVAIPKFKITTSINVKSILENLGVNKVFSNTADLSGIAGNPGDLKVDQVQQKAFIDVNEGGVEAAAATYVSVGLTSVIQGQQPIDFKADRPFIFLIRYYNVTLFAGRVTEPKYE